jgi:hypothetical protein
MKRTLLAFGAIIALSINVIAGKADQMFNAVWFHEMSYPERHALVESQRAWEAATNYDHQSEARKEQLAAARIAWIRQQVTAMRTASLSQSSTQAPVQVKRAEPVQSAPVSQETPAPHVSSDSLQPAAGLGTLVIRKGAVIADTVEHLDMAKRCLFDGDTASVAPMVEDGTVVILKADTRAYCDGCDFSHAKLHFASGASIPYVADNEDIKLDKPPGVN